MFEWNGEDSEAVQLSDLCQKMIGREFGDIQPVSTDKFPFAFFFYRKFVTEIKGSFHIHAYQKGRDPQDLICRCFGVYGADIHELVGKGIEVNSIRDLGDHLKAGIGCGTCHHDLKETLAPLISAPVLEEEQPLEMSMWEKLDPQRLARECHRILKKWNESEGNGQSLELKGTKPGSVLLGLKGDGAWTKETVIPEIKKLVDAELGPGLALIVLT
jgi:bacterioferritin-associated ferredoxin